MQQMSRVYATMWKRLRHNLEEAAPLGGVPGPCRGKGGGGQRVPCCLLRLGKGSRLDNTISPPLSRRGTPSVHVAFPAGVSGSASVLHSATTSGYIDTSMQLQGRVCSQKNWDSESNACRVNLFLH